MKNNSNLRLIGKIKDAHSLRGEVFIIFFSKDYSWVGEITQFFLSDSKTLDVIRAAPHKDGLKVQLKDVTNRNQSEALIGTELYLPEAFFSSGDGESLYLTEIENYKVIDETLGELGQIIGFSSNTAQDLLIVKSVDGKKEFEIPFVDDFVIEIDDEKETIVMDLPEGLLEINYASAIKDDGDGDEV